MNSHLNSNFLFILVYTKFNLMYIIYVKTIRSLTSTYDAPELKFDKSLTLTYNNTKIYTVKNSLFKKS